MGVKLIIKLCLMIVLSGICMSEVYSGIEEMSLPSLKTLSEKVVIREKLFDKIESDMTFNVYNQGSDKPVFKHSCKWVKCGGKVFIDFQSRDYLDANQEVFRHIKMGYDGQTARSLSVTQMKAKIATDWEQDALKGHYYGPDIIGITLPMTAGHTISSLLQEEPLLSPSLLKSVNRSVRVTGKASVDNEMCVVVEVCLGDLPDRKEVLRFYMAEQYDYCVLQCEHSFVRDGVSNLRSRIKMSKFQCIKENLWYPMEAKYDIFKGKELKQSTVFKIDSLCWPDKFEESLFNLEFPVGTHVFDTVVGIDYVTGGGYVQEPRINGEEINTDFPINKVTVTTAEVPQNKMKNTTESTIPTTLTESPSKTDLQKSISNETSSQDNHSSISKSYFPSKIIPIVLVILAIAIIIVVKCCSIVD